MRRFAAVALVFAGLGLPALGQHRGGAVSGGGFSAHSAPAPRMSSSAPAARFNGPGRSFSAPAARFTGTARGFTAPRYTMRPQAAGPQYRSVGARVPVGRIGDRRDGHHRRMYISGYGAGYPYAYGPWITPGYPTILDYDDGDDSGAQQGPVNGGYGDQGYAGNGGDGSQPESGPPQGAQYLGPWPSIPPSTTVTGGQTRASSSAMDQGITLIFKNGRPPEQVHNYVLTQNSIFVGDARGVTIPLDELDLAATAKANRDAGVDFEIPSSLH